MHELSLGVKSCFHSARSDPLSEKRKRIARACPAISAEGTARCASRGYDVQYKELSQARGRGHLYSDSEGRYSFWSVRPQAYPIPDDGPVGELLEVANRSSMRPAHVHFMIKAPGYKTLITRVFKEGDPYLDSDAVFGVKSSLITGFERHEPGTALEGKQMDAPFYTMSYDFVLAPAEEKGGHSS